MNERVMHNTPAADMAFDAGYQAEVGVPSAQLPAQSDGDTTECWTGCRWAVGIIKAGGNFNVSWMLNAAEHCPTCRARARHRNRGGWQQLRIRGGRLTDASAPLFATALSEGT